MRKYLVFFLADSKYNNKYAEVKGSSKDNAYWLAVLKYGHGVIAEVVPANVYAYNKVMLWGKTLV